MPVNYVANTFTEIRGSVERLTDDSRRTLLIWRRGYQVLHALRDPPRRQASQRYCRRQRMEWRGGAAAAAHPGPRQPRTAGASGTELRPGLGRHPYPALGPIALSIPWRTSFPS